MPGAPRTPGASAAAGRRGRARRRRTADRAAPLRQLGRLHRPDRGSATASTTCPRRPSTSSSRSTASRSTTPTPRSRTTSRSWRRSGRSSRRASTTGWDLIVLTDWMAAKVVEAGWAEELDPANSPTAARQRPRRAQGPAVGPGHEVPLPVAVGRDRRRLQQQVDRPRADQDRRPVRPGLRRARSRSSARPATCSRSSTWPSRRRAQASDTPAEEHDRRGRPGRPRLPQAVRRQRPHPGLHRQRVPAGLRRAATRGPRWSGPATSPRRPGRTTCSSSPRRGR